MPILRRIFAVVLLLGVVLTTLGAAHARCMHPGLAQAAPGAMEGMEHGGRGDDDAPGHDGCGHEPRSPGSPGERGTDAAPCLFVAHCGVAMLAVDVPLAGADARVAAPRIASPAARPAARALEPDSPPPRA